MQINGGDNVVIGDDIFDQKDTDLLYVYSYHFVDKNKADDFNYSKQLIEMPTLFVYNNNTDRLEFLNGVGVGLDDENGEITFILYESMRYNVSTGAIINTGAQATLDTNKDLVIVKHTLLSNATKIMETIIF